jgi:GNAT superfamily N-acetyltransferase
MGDVGDNPRRVEVIPITQPVRPPPPDRDDYRALDRFTRAADTQYADPLGNVVDAIANDADDRRPIQQLADDLSGRYGPFAVSWQSNDDYDWASIDGEVSDRPGTPVGTSTRTFFRAAPDYLVVNNDYLALDEAAQGQGFATALYDELQKYYRRSCVDVITIHAALDVGGYAWARRGFEWDPRYLAVSFADVRGHIDQLIDNPETAPADQQLLKRMSDRLDENDPGEGWPTPNELARLRGVDPELGRKLMVETDWFGIFPLSEGGWSFGT